MDDHIRELINEYVDEDLRAPLINFVSSLDADQYELLEILLEAANDKGLDDGVQIGHID